MAHNQVLSFSSIPELVNLNGLYLAGYGWLFGMSVWISFFGGIIAFRALPRHQFGALQHKTFPVYFTVSIALSTALLGIWVTKFPEVLTNYARPQLAVVAQAYALASVLVSQAANLLVVGPMTSKIMFKRQRQEKEEGVTYNDPKASSQMKALNKQFGVLHGVSSLLNLGAVIALGLHGLWLGNAAATGL